MANGVFEAEIALSGGIRVMARVGRKADGRRVAESYGEKAETCYVYRVQASGERGTVVAAYLRDSARNWYCALI